MTPEEVQAFLREERTMSVATIGRDSRAHVVAMWFAFIDGQPAFWTYARSQKILNLKRDPRITALVEAGERYEELHGVELVCDATIIEDPDAVLDFGVQLTERYQGPVTEAALPFIKKNASKRVVVQLNPAKIVSWDHRKLGGVY
jgi:PPOX class probable F420-dependent enzyme